MKKSKRVSFAINEELYDKLKEKADSQSSTVSFLIKYAISEYLKKAK